MFKKEESKLKIEEIRLSPELLRINSCSTSGGGLAKIIFILIVSLSLIFYKDIIHILKDKEPDEQLVLVAIVLLFLAAFFFTLFRMNRNSGKTLAITEKGFFIAPDLAEFWKDIDEYRWNSFSNAISNLTSGQKEVSSIVLIKNKGGWPKTFDLTLYDIFFTPEQIQQVDNICNRLGIKKMDG